MENGAEGLNRLANVIQRVGLGGRQQIAGVEHLRPGNRVRIIGQINALRRTVNTIGETMAILDLCSSCHALFHENGKLVR